MSKFNLVNYQKINGSDHIEQRLREQHGKESNQISEGQLKSYRGVEKDSITEKQLDKARAGASEVLTEKQLDNAKNKHRNAKASEGNINKLEEKRLANSPIEKEKRGKSQLASETAKEFRWWENVKSPDGLKIAKTIVAQTMQDVQTMQQEQEPSNRKPFGSSEIETEDFPIVDMQNDESGDSSTKTMIPAGMYILKETYLNGVLPGIYFLLGYNPEEFEGNIDQIKEAALQKVLASVPALGGLISADDFGMPDESGVDGKIAMRVVGDEFSAIVQSNGQLKGDAGEDTDAFEEVDYVEKNVGGTEMAKGLVKVVGITIDETNEDQVIKDTIAFIQEKHPGLYVDINALDLSKMDSNLIGYMTAKNPIPESSKLASSDFPIIIAKNTKKN
ncbi:MAG: hypothetical protein WC375_07280 [Methanomassiliicoccales archaeon]|jgi:hypothetical protein